MEGNWIFIVLVFAALAVAGYMHRDKLRGIFDKGEPKQEPKQEPKPVPPSIIEPGPATNPTFAKIREALAFLEPRMGIGAVTLYEVQRRVGHGLSSEEIAYAKSFGVVVREDAVPAGPIDRSGDDLSSGAPLTRTGESGVWHEFQLDHPGGPLDITVAGSSSQLVSVEDQLFPVTGIRVSNASTGGGGRSKLRFDSMDAGHYVYRVSVTFTADNGTFAVQYVRG